MNFYRQASVPERTFSSQTEPKAVPRPENSAPTVPSSTPFNYSTKTIPTYRSDVVQRVCSICKGKGHDDKDCPNLDRIDSGLPRDTHRDSDAYTFFQSGQGQHTNANVTSEVAYSSMENEGIPMSSLLGSHSLPKPEQVNHLAKVLAPQSVKGQDDDAREARHKLVYRYESELEKGKNTSGGESDKHFKKARNLVPGITTSAEFPATHAQLAGKGETGEKGESDLVKAAVEGVTTSNYPQGFQNVDPGVANEEPEIVHQAMHQLADLANVVTDQDVAEDSGDESPVSSPESFTKTGRFKKGK